MKLQLHAGPIDGEILEIPGIQAGDVLEVELTGGSTARYRLEQWGSMLHGYYDGELRRGHETDLKSYRIADSETAEDYTWDGAGPILEREQRHDRATEIFAATWFAAALGCMAGCLLALATLAGDFLHGLTGSWVDLVLWLSAGAGLFGLITATLTPTVWRRNR